MKKHIKRALMHPLISGSGIIFAGSFVANILNYVFNLVMGRLLSVAEYGLLISLTALVVLLTIVQTPLIMIFTKFAARHFAKDENAAIPFLIWSGTKISFWVGLSYLILLFLLTVPLSNFLHINSGIIMITVFLSVLFSILGSLPSGILQGGLRFIQVSVISVIGTFIKICIGVGLVFLGYGVIGGVIGILSSFAAPYAITYLYIWKKYGIKIRSKSEIDFISEFKKVSGPFFAASIAVAILQGTDVIFARHFLGDVDAGLFAGLSLMGKAVFYITSPIYFAFFPVIAHKYEKKERTTGTLFLALSIVLLSSLVFTGLYFTFPHMIISVFFPAPAYQALAPYLGFYSLYISIFSFVFLLNNYFLSVGKINVYKLNWMAVIMYVFLLFFFHSSIGSIIGILMFSSLLLLCLLLVYYWRYEAH